MKVTMMLCDAAQEVGGKLFILGGGWSVTGPVPMPSAIAILFAVPWDETDRKHEFTLELLDSDGNNVTDEQGNGVRIEGGIETGRPPGIKRGTPIDQALAVTIPPMGLAPDSRFEWRLTVNGESKEDWRAPFTTRPPLPSSPYLPACRPEHELASLSQRHGHFQVCQVSGVLKTSAQSLR